MSQIRRLFSLSEYGNRNRWESGVERAQYRAGDTAELGETRFEDWLSLSTNQPPPRSRRRARMARDAPESWKRIAENPPLSIRKRFEVTGIARKGECHEYYHNERWNGDLLQRLGRWPGSYVLAWLALECRHVGWTNALPRTERLPSSGARPAWPRPIQPGFVRQ